MLNLMEHPLLRLWHFVISPNYSRTLTILVLLTIAAAVPLTVYVSQQRQELRQRAREPNCLDEGYQAGNVKHDCSTTSRACASEENGVGVPYVCNANGSWSLVDPPGEAGECTDDCDLPPEPTSTPEPTAVPNTPIPNTPVPNTPIPPPATATPGTGGPSCPQIYVMWKVGSGNWSSRIDTSLANASQVQGGVFISGGQQPVNASDIVSLSFSGPNYSQGAGNPFKFIPLASGTYEITARHKCGSNSLNEASLNVASTGTSPVPTSQPGRICLQCVNNVFQNATGCGSTNCENVTVVNGTLCMATPNVRGASCGPGTPTATPTTPPGQATATPIPAGTKFSLILNLQGIGSGIGENPSPKNTTKQVTLQLFDPVSDRQIAEGKGDLTYDPSTETFKGTANVSANIATGNYTVRVKSKRYLRRRFPGVHRITTGGTYTGLPQVSLVVGDANDDNKLTIEDYHAFISCFEGKATTSSCSDMDAVDFNGDGKVDIADFKLQALSFQTRQGD